MNLLFYFIFFLLLVDRLHAAEPVKWVPRPIPGMTQPDVIKPMSESLKAAQSQKKNQPVRGLQDQARILFIHRKNMLPAELTKNPITVPPSSQSAEPILKIQQEAVKIIPMSEVPSILLPKK